MDTKNNKRPEYRKGIRSMAFLLFFSLFTPVVDGQVLISLLLGDELNSPKIEFGLMGGINRSYFLDVETSEGLNNLNLGFYFHINLKESSFLSTGVLVKSNVGATGMPVYPIGDDDLDDVFKDGTLTTKISYFYVPILFHQRFNNSWYLEGGLQAGLRSKARDYFDKDYYEGELDYKMDVGDQYARLDAGLFAGVGYKFKKELKSMSVGINYYYGLVNVSKVPDVTIKNSYINVFVKIPIGLGESKKETQE
ncbi:MAG: PorT family protein [Bacteroidetes bacterium]|nr:MAG: PorT family protein [Bacteroidota bacterium]